jgi:hypothetical protein
MADVGTHLADLAQWTLFPEQKISYRSDIRMLQATHSPLKLTLPQFTRLTGESAWPSFLKNNVVNGELADYANGSCVYALKGVHVHLKVGWQYEAAPGVGDSYFASYQGTRAQVELRAGPKESFVPEIYLTPVAGEVAYQVNLKAALSRLQAQYPGLTYVAEGHSFHLLLPKSDRQVDGLRTIFQQFAGFVENWRTFPAFENANLLAKYYVTTTAVQMANSKK